MRWRRVLWKQRNAKDWLGRKEEKREEKREEKLLEINSNEYKNWNGTTTPTLNAIKKYRQYSEFKTSTFIAKDSEYEDGQIKNMYFEFSK